MVKEYLSRYRELAKEIKAKNEQLEELREQIGNISSPDLIKAKSTGIGDRTGRIAVNIFNLEMELTENMNKLVNLQREIRRTIDSVEDDTLRLLLELRYINGKTWEEISFEMDYTYKWVHILHRKALNKIHIEI